MENKVATRVAYGQALAEYGENKNVVALDADLACCTNSCMFRDKYPERFFNIGIAEANMMGIAAGIATTGKNVFASSFAMFAAGRAFEQVRNSIAYPNLNVKVVGTHAGISVGEDGATHQCIEDLSIMRTIPNMTVVCPSDSVETMAAVKALTDFYGPVYLRIGRIPIDVVNDYEGYKFELGKGNLMREGNDVTVIATGMMVGEAIKAHEALKKEGINARIINIHTIKPIDKDIIIKAAKETGAIVTAEEHNIIGGLGSAVSEVLSENCPVKMKRVGVKDKFGKSGKPEELFKKYGLTPEAIVTAVHEILANK